jgi:cytochrome c-type biogenesis protein
MHLTFGLAFIAGIASFLSPCVFSLMPVYVSYLTGRSIEENYAKSVRWNTLFHGVFFIFGFSFVFISLGLAFSAIGSILYSLKDVLMRVGGIVIILFGIHMVGIFHLPFLDYDLRPHSTLDSSRGFLSSFLLGVFFSAGWSPCVGPVLGSILTLALTSGNIQSGFWMLIAYSLGMAIPFLLTAGFLEWARKLINGRSRLLKWIEVGMGWILIIVGVLLLSGAFSRLATMGNWLQLGL